MKNEKEILNNLGKAVMNNAQLLPDEIEWLKNHKEAVLKYGNIDLAQLADISYDECLAGELNFIK